MKIKKKLSSRKGETLVETLIAVLLVALISAAMGSMLMATKRINEVAADHDVQIRTAVTAMETVIAGGISADAVEEAPQELEIKVGRTPGTYAEEPIKLPVVYYHDGRLGKLNVYKKN